MKAHILTLTALLFVLPSFAQTTAKEGLERLKSNYENSKANLEDYRKNLKIIEGNLSEVAKAKATAVDQERQVKKASDENQASLKTVEKREGEINGLIGEEEKQIKQEEVRIQDLEKLANQLRENQKKRQANIQSYQTQLKSVSDEKKEWKSRGEQVAKNHAEAKGKVSTLTAQETEWKNKKRGYEGEISRWQKEVDRHKKQMDNQTSLTDVKD